MIKVEKFRINHDHHTSIGSGFIFDHLTFQINEYIDEPHNVTSRRTVFEFEFKPLRSVFTDPITFYADRSYEFSLFQEINQRVINNQDERYKIDIDFTIRNYYQSSLSRNYFREYSY